MKSRYAATSIIFLLLSFSAAVAQTTPLPCVPAGANDSEPWEHTLKVLDSFPAAKPAPVFLGNFPDKKQNYRLRIYSDAQGIFGEISSPVLEADSPTSRLYDLAFNPATGALQFQGKFGYRQIQFTGSLSNQTVRGVVKDGQLSETVVLRKSRASDETSYASRAQFDCAMILFGRY
jgi:hypothetical protein